MKSGIHIRQFQGSDREAVRQLCCDTGFLGEPIDPVFEDRELFANYLTRYYTVSRGAFANPVTLKALDGASFTLEHGKTLAVVGESGCGKSTLARIVTMIETPTSGSMAIAGQEIVGASNATMRGLRPKVQIVFQNPYGSLNPRQKIGHALEEPLLVNTSIPSAERRERVQAPALRP